MPSHRSSERSIRPDRSPEHYQPKLETPAADNDGNGGSLLPPNAESVRQRLIAVSPYCLVQPSGPYRPPLTVASPGRGLITTDQTPVMASMHAFEPLLVPPFQPIHRSSQVVAAAG